MRFSAGFPCLLLACLAFGESVLAKVRLPYVFTHHMVLQRDQPAPVWGKAAPGEKIVVQFGEQQQPATTDADGRWRVDLESLAASDEPRELVVTGSASQENIVVRDVLVGDVWVCSGQSNMQWTVGRSKDADLTLAAANRPSIRLLQVENLGDQRPMDDIDQPWHRCTAESLKGFSAVGYHFGEQLQESLGVPIGLIRNAWGGSACEAWAPRDRMSDEPAIKPYLDSWVQREAKPGEDALRAEHAQQLADFYKRRDAAYAAGEKTPGRPWIESKLFQQHRPGNLYNARVLPLVPFAIKGVIWYQGESNAGRAEAYKTLFPLMIQSWRDVWGQGDFPFYWVQLADFRTEATVAAEDSDWAVLREAQTQTAERLPNSGQAVIIDLGESNDIHPKNKRDVGLRLARLALAETYGLPIKGRSATFESLEIEGSQAVVTIQDVAGGLRTFDGVAPRGFALAGEDRVFHDAQAKLIEGNRLELTAPGVEAPLAVRYGWANNPVVNVFDSAWLPLTPFRTDDWR